jgi:hypothetical protein
MVTKIQGVLQLDFQFKQVGHPHAPLESEANTVRSITENEKRKATPLLHSIYVSIHQRCDMIVSGRDSSAFHVNCSDRGTDEATYNTRSLPTG